MLTVAYANGKTSHAREVKDDNPDKKGYPGPPGWELGVRLTTPPSKKNIFFRNLKEMKLDGYWQQHWAIYKSLRLRTRNKFEFNTGTLNVRSLYKAGALRTLIN